MRLRCWKLATRSYDREEETVQWLALLPHSKRVAGSNSVVGEPLCAESACSPHDSISFLQVLQLPPTVQRHAG